MNKWSNINYSAHEKLNTLINDHILNKDQPYPIRGWGEAFLNILKRIVTLGQFGHKSEETKNAEIRRNAENLHSLKVRLQEIKSTAPQPEATRATQLEIVDAPEPNSTSRS
jgi:hypothetical protein